MKEAIYKTLYEKYGTHMLSIADASREMGLAVQTGYNRLANGTYPVPVLREPGANPRVRLLHLVVYLSGDKLPAGRGRPTKAQQIARRRAGKLQEDYTQAS